MTDQIYYKVQYPVKKAINTIKKVDPEDPFAGNENYTQADLNKIKDFLDIWETEGKASIQSLIKELRKIK